MIASRLHEPREAYRGPGRLHGPLLAVTATHLRLFQSDREEVGAPQLAASTAIPRMFEPVPLDGALYGDGDMVRHSLFPLQLDRLRRSGKLAAAEIGQESKR